MKMIMFNSIQVINYWFTLHRALRFLYQQAQTSSSNIQGISDQDVTDCLIFDFHEKHSGKPCEVISKGNKPSWTVIDSECYEFNNIQINKI